MNPPNTPAAEPSGQEPLRKRLKEISKKHWLYLPRLFSKQERLRLLAIALVAIAAFGVFAGRMVARFTVPKPAVGGILREGAVGEPRFINPIYATADTDRDLAAIVFGRLIRYNAAGNPEGDLAESFDVSDDGKTYTVRLRPGIQWHDGEPMSADDVLFTVKTIQDPDYKSPLRPNWQGVTAERVDERTVRFELRQAYAPFLENLSIGILPEHLWRRIPRDSAALSDLNLKPVGAGPYRFGKFTRLENGTITSVTLERFLDYHLPGPYLKEIEFVFYPSEEKLAAAYRKNEIDSLALSSKAGVSDLEKLDAAVYPLEAPKIFAVFLNPGTKSVLGRKAVREALSLAIDRQALLDKAAGGGGSLVNGPIPPGSLGYDPGIAGIGYDPDRARDILKSDGFAETKGVLARSEGRGKKRTAEELTITLVTSAAPELSTTANLIAEMWNAIGVRTEVKTYSVADLEKTMIRPRAYEALLFGEVFGHDPDPFAFWHTSQIKDPGLNIALYSNRAVDRLLEETRRTSDSNLRETKYRQFQNAVASDLGAIFLYSPRSYYVVRKTIHGIHLEAVALTDERFNDVAFWYQKTGRRLK